MVDTRPGVASYARVSYARELMGDVPGAIQAMEAARDIAGTPADAAWASYQLGELYFNQGDLAAAEHAYARGVDDGRRLRPAVRRPREGGVGARATCTRRSTATRTSSRATPLPST